MSTMTSSMVFVNKPTRFHLKSYMQRPQDMPWNPVSKLGFSNFKNTEIRFGGNKSSLHLANKPKRNSLTVYANIVPGTPLPSTSPSGSTRSWILGMVVSLILPFFSHKWGPLWVIKHRIDNAVQTVEDIVEAVEKVAKEVDKIAEDISDDLPQGKFKEMVDLVEDMAEKTAKTADSLDNLIDKVQEAEEQMEDIVESMNNKVNSSKQEATVAN